MVISPTKPYWAALSLEFDNARSFQCFFFSPLQKLGEHPERLPLEEDRQEARRQHMRGAGRTSGGQRGHADNQRGR